jgi:hypothetical protein
MKFTTIAAIAVITLSTSFVQAQEDVAVDNIVKSANDGVSSLASTDITEILARITPVCALDNVVLSDKAQRACDADEPSLPKILKDGSRFSSRGVGAEFNVLIANLASFQ